MEGSQVREEDRVQEAARPGGDAATLGDCGMDEPTACRAVELLSVSGIQVGLKAGVRMLGQKAGRSEHREACFLLSVGPTEQVQTEGKAGAQDSLPLSTLIHRLPASQYPVIWVMTDHLTDWWSS